MSLPVPMSPETDGVPGMANGEVSRGRDESSWPDDVTDLGHSEVFDDSLSEPRKSGKDLEGAVVRHDRDRQTESAEERDQKDHEAASKSPHSKKKYRKESYPPIGKDEDYADFSRGPKPRHRSSGHGRMAKLPQERKQSDESIRKDSPTKVKANHRPFVDSPRERRRGSSQSGKLRYKIPDDVAQEVFEAVGKKEARKQSKSPKIVLKTGPHAAVVEPDILSKAGANHRREPSILRMDDLRRAHGRGTKDQTQEIPAGVKSSHHRSSSDDSQSLHTIPVIKVKSTAQY